MISLFALLGVFGLSAGLGASAFDYQELNHQVNLVVDSQKLQPKLVIYDDNGLEITLDINETLFHFDNLATLYNSISTFQSDVSLNYQSNIFSYHELVQHDYMEWDYQNNYIQLGLSNDDRFGYFSFYDDTISSDTDFLTPLTIVFDTQSSYSLVKQAIELDIQANTADINSGIFSTLTDSIVAFVGSLGSGITAMTGVFWDSANNQLTTIGLLSVIVVAVSLTYFLFRLIIGLIRMRG